MAAVFVIAVSFTVTSPLRASLFCLESASILSPSDHSDSSSELLNASLVPFTFVM